MSNLKVFVLMAGLTALLAALGQAIGGQSGFVMALAIAGVMNFVAYFASAQIALRAYGARVVTAQQAPRLYAMVDRLRQRAGLPMPTVAVAPHAQPNAFATGRNPEHAVVCVTEGLLNTVNDAELEGVLAHELAHIQHRDMLLMTVAATLAAAISHLAYVAMFMGGRNDEEGGNPIAGLLMIILAPIGAMLIQFAIGRQREFKADAGGAQISGQPLALASALKKLDAAAHRVPMRVEPAMAPLAQVNPLAAHGRGVLKLFSTHPPTAERVARLEAIAFGSPSLS
ncbi:MAG TPA: zinc metalloprotease HtpX [Gemmatimonadales bacterium]|nr:zinc metalloprotease HtpX [Gemmatimonadales bacterium]